MRGEVPQPATYPQAKPYMAAVCKTVASAFLQLLVRRAVARLLSSLRVDLTGMADMGAVRNTCTR